MFQKLRTSFVSSDPLEPLLEVPTQHSQFPPDHYNFLYNAGWVVLLQTFLVSRENHRIGRQM